MFDLTNMANMTNQVICHLLEDIRTFPSDPLPGESSLPRFYRPQTAIKLDTTPEQSLNDN